VATERRPYHRTADSIGDEHWTNDELACITRFSAHLHSRWRTDRIMDPEEACRAVLGPAELMRVTGKLTPSSARALAERCAELVSWSLEARGKLTSIHWPKWAEFQGLAPETGAPSGRKQSPSASSVQRPSPEEEEERERGALSRSLNQLAKEPGSEAEKRAFLEAELPRIEAEAFAALPADRAGDKRALNAKIRSMILGWYRQRRRNPDGPNRPGPSNGRRLTAVEAGRKILADIERRGRAPDGDLLAPVHAVPALGDAGR
jgi:hypothetical protein